ncbi:MAG: bifunctional N-acetylglucosamine-1-phosphate uridyltransferase/glucosamine-1-phosphate acetyltransferase [Planctomycetes bacterium]|nr:bifunctional N-acetylglucosamine-1-phosphate uridyltransferase/glucosamine-1-phosphate acetyltransferase [Planctomycetota bacterium]MCB9916893.1 bifunctional N-acetylglucosamine-1-phosphate uridyltransferase/glucosamine-1-phosphate acetyltransferase [Planctomycetota bacterium]
MSDKPLAVIVLAAGKGTRTKVSTPKVLLPLCGSPMLDYVLDAAAALEPRHTVVVLHHAKDVIVKALGARFEREKTLIVDQGTPKGTGHAVRVALAALDEAIGAPFVGDVLVIYGDTPLITPETLRELVDALHRPASGMQFGNGSPKAGAGAALLVSDEMPPEGMGRILRDEQGYFVGIREERDCSDDELDLIEVNTGFCAFQSAVLRDVLPDLESSNDQGEFYLTDAFALVLGRELEVETVFAHDPDEAVGVNDLRQLSEARWFMQERIHDTHMARGVVIEDPATTVIERDVEIGPETHILPFTVIRNGVRIGSHCEVGPFTHLRVGATLDDEAEVGNFVEMKKSRLGHKSKAKHLTYLGDTTIGKRANIGAGTITANYDGRHKYETTIADGAFIGSGTIIVAPSKVGEGAVTGAGAVVTKDVPEGEVYVGVPARRFDKKPKGEHAGGNEG